MNASTKSIYLLAGLLLGACGHDAKRDNPVDPALTPSVEVVSVAVDSLSGSATIAWSAYRGDQPFMHYQIERRTAGQDSSAILDTIVDIGVTSFVDTGLVADRVYFYSISVVNTALVRAAGHSTEVSYTPAPPRLEATIDSRTASATLRWNRALPGFERYEVQRQIEGESGILIVHRSEDHEDTTFTDRSLLGNTRYIYTLVIRSVTGTELESEPAGGIFHAFSRQWELPQEMRGVIAVDPEDRIYVACFGPNTIFQFDTQGNLLNEFNPHPSKVAFDFIALAADQHGFYAAEGDQNGEWINAFDASGKLRFVLETPPPHIMTGLATDGDRLWMSVANMNNFPSGKLYEFDAATGERLSSLEVAPPLFYGISIANGLLISADDDPPAYHLIDPSSGMVIQTALITGGDGGLVIPGRAQFGLNESVFVTDQLRAQVHVFREGEYVTLWGLNTGSSVYDLVIDSHGDIYVASPGNNVLQVFDP